MEEAGKGQAKKKTAAKKGGGGKRAKRKPEPVPTDPLVVGIGDMPAVPLLRHALVSWGTGNGHQADLDTALLARELSEKHCHFCGTHSSPTLALGTPWDKVQLCTCLERASLGVEGYVQQMTHFGQGVKAVVVPTAVTTPASEGSAMADFVKKYGKVRVKPNPYQEFFPNWRNRIDELMELAKERRIEPGEVIYANECVDCGTPFSVTARMIVNSVKQHEAHSEMRRCWDCRAVLLANLAAANASAGTVPATTTEAPVAPASASEPMARPRNKRGKHRSPKNRNSQLVASTGAGEETLITLGEMLGPALEQLRQGEAS